MACEHCTDAPDCIQICDDCDLYCEVCDDPGVCGDIQFDVVDGDEGEAVE
jgi:hypothetical protein